MQAMTNNGHSFDEAIRIEAYLLSEQAGHPGGMEHVFWKQAETIVHSRLTSKITKKKISVKSKSVSVKSTASAKSQPAKKPAAAAIPKKGKVDVVQEPLPQEMPAALSAVTVKKAASVKKTNASAAKTDSVPASKPAVTKKGKTAKSSRK